MDLNTIETLLRTLETNGIIACLVGEIALNYYNVPRVIHGIEICVTASEIPKAAGLFKSLTSLLATLDDQDYDVFTEYRRGFPQFRILKDPPGYVALFPDHYLGLNPLPQNLIPPHLHQRTTFYSHEIVSLVPTSKIASIPLPLLPPFFVGVCHRYLTSRDIYFAMAAEQLVDGMDLDDAWCNRYLGNEQLDVLQFAKRLVQEKPGRVSDFAIDDTVASEAGNARGNLLSQLPGRDLVGFWPWVWRFGQDFLSKNIFGRGLRRFIVWLTRLTYR